MVDSRKNDERKRRDTDDNATAPPTRPATPDDWRKALLPDDEMDARELQAKQGSRRW